MSDDPRDDWDDFDDDEPDEVERVLGRERFVQARFDVGYQRAEVDALVEALRTAYVETGRIDGVIEAHVLHTAGFREGYEITEVEDWLAELVEVTETQLGEREIIRPVADPWTQTRPSRKERPAQPEAVADTPSVITEHRSLLSRLRHH